MTWIIFGTCSVSIGPPTPAPQIIPVGRFRLAYSIPNPYGLLAWLGMWVYPEIVDYLS